MPVRLACGHKVAEEGQTHYCDYLRLTDLLGVAPAEVQHPDEHLFISVHQSFEIWFRQLLVDLPRLIAALNDDDVGLATWLAQRITTIARLFPPTIQVLERMLPSDFFAFRAHLAPASGTESLQFHAVELLSGLRHEPYRKHLEQPVEQRPEGNRTLLWTERLLELWDAPSVNSALVELLARRGIVAADIYTVAPERNQHADLLLLAEALLDYDEAMRLWRTAHARTAERAIGPDLPGTSHTSGVRYLDYAANRPYFFPALWEARTTLWERMVRQQASSKE